MIDTGIEVWSIRIIVQQGSVQVGDRFVLAFRILSGDNVKATWVHKWGR